MDIDGTRSWVSGRAVTESPFALPRGLAGRLAGWIMCRTNRQEDVVRLLGVCEGDRVLEVGYGPGELVRLLAEQVGDGTVCGVDPSAEMHRLARARNRAAVRTGRVDLRLGTAQATGLPDASFDRVVTVNTVALWPDLEAGVRELRRVTRPGGVVLVAWHGGEAPGRFTRSLVLPDQHLNRIRDALSRDFPEVTRHELRALTAFRAVRP